MDSDNEEYCDVWAETTKNLEDESLSSVTFSLFFHVSFIHLPLEDEDEDEVFEINNLTESAIDTQAFSVTRDQLIYNDTSQETLEGILSSMHVPSRPFFKEKILSFARAMADDKTYEGYKVLRMHVRMCVVVVDEVVEEEETTIVVGASKKAIQRLEIVKFDDDNKDGFRGLCAICLEEFLLGFQVTRLPNCCHIFHGDCILDWLNKSRLCPLCRDEIN